MGSIRGKKVIVTARLDPILLAQVLDFYARQGARIPSLSFLVGRSIGDLTALLGKHGLLPPARTYEEALMRLQKGAEPRDTASSVIRELSPASIDFPEPASATIEDIARLLAEQAAEEQAAEEEGTT